MHRSLMAITAAAALAAANLFAQQAPASAARAPGPCASSADRHRFDFWIGEWNVTTKGGSPTGTSSVQSVSGGCGLLENWTDLRGGTGKSLNAYNPIVGEWQQYWVGQGGAVTEYRESKWTGKSVSFITRTPAGPNVPASIGRLTFTPLDDGSVRQLGETSSDDGKTWTVTYDFYYHRR